MRVLLTSAYLSPGERTARLKQHAYQPDQKRPDDYEVVTHRYREGGVIKEIKVVGTRKDGDSIRFEAKTLSGKTLCTLNRMPAGDGNYVWVHPEEYGLGGGSPPESVTWNRIGCATCEDITFESPQGSDEARIMQDLATFHDRLMAKDASGEYIVKTYAQAVEIALRMGRITITVSDQFAWAGCAKWDNRSKAHRIEVNPSRDVADGSSSAKILNARRLLVFEMQNCKTAQQFYDMHEKVTSGHFAMLGGLYPFPYVSEPSDAETLESWLMRNENDSSAVHYAIAKESQEWENLQAVPKIEHEIVAAGISNEDGLNGEGIKYAAYETFGDYLASQVDREHAKSYLDDYDFIIGQTVGH